MPHYRKRVIIFVLNEGEILRNNLDEKLKKLNFNYRTFKTARELINAIKTSPCNIVLTDFEMKNEDCLSVLRMIRSINSQILTIVTTSYEWEDIAILAIDEKVIDYLVIPYNYTEIRLVLEKAVDRLSLTEERKQLQRQLEERYKFDNIIGKSKKMQHVYNIINLVAKQDVSVLIGGESGTGKDLVASAIHYNSHRKNRPFIKLNCAALPSELIESELFGYEKGAFTGAYMSRAGKFEQAHRGTIFLDEIGDMALSTQAKILRVIENREIEKIGGKGPVKVDVRIICATNKNLVAEVEKGNFREDLFYRLNVVNILLPPLRERKEDIMLLTNYFIEKFCKKFNKTIRGVDFEVMRKFREYHWPGNVRELQNVLESAIVLEQSDMITLQSLPYDLAPATMPHIRDEKEVLKGNLSDEKATAKHEQVEEILNQLLKERKLLEEKLQEITKNSTDNLDPYQMLLTQGLTLEDIERNLIIKALELSEGVQKKAARMLGLGKGAIQYKLKKYKINLSDFN